MLISVRLGSLDAGAELTEKSEFRLEAGESYGYVLQILAAEAAVEIVDILLLPEAVKRLPGCVEDLSIEEVQGMQGHEEVIVASRTLEKRDQIRFVRGFRMNEEDPLGTYALLVFVNARPVGCFPFSVMG